MGKLGLILTIGGAIATAVGSVLEIHDTCNDCREQFNEELEDVRQIKKELEDRTKTS